MTTINKFKNPIIHHTEKINSNVCIVILNFKEYYGTKFKGLQRKFSVEYRDTHLDSQMKE